MAQLADRVRRYCERPTRLLQWLLPGLFLLLLMRKAWIDYDPYWDTWIYHIPFAGRLWHIIPADMYEMEPNLEQYFLGRPLLAEWVQGLLWASTGHGQATNFVSLFSLTIYVIFLHKRFAVPLLPITIALLAIPLVQIHATSSYVDLPANLALSALILLTWQLLADSAAPGRRQILAILLSAFLAANVKFQMLPLVTVVLAVAARDCWLKRPWHLSTERGEPWPYVAAAVALAAIYYVPLYDTVAYGNPLYPFHFGMLRRDPDSGLAALPYGIYYLHRGLPPVAWLFSVLELQRPFGTWSLDMYYMPTGRVGDRTGGFFNFYVLAQVIFLIIYCLRHRNCETARTCQFFRLITVAAALMPQAYELRYYQFWMIVLVSINLVLWSRDSAATAMRRALVSVNLAAFLLVVALTNGQHLLPKGITLGRLQEYVPCCLPPTPFASETMDARLKALPAGSTICVRNREPYAVLYASYWHSPGRYKVVARRASDKCDMPHLPFRR